MIDFEQIKLDPTEHFSAPEEVLASDELTTAQKIEILQRWKYDVCELQVAEEENMPSTNDTSDLLQRISLLLRQLGASHNPDDMPSTKQGGE